MLTVQESAASKQPVKLARVLKVRLLEIDRLVDLERTEEGTSVAEGLDRGTMFREGRRQDRRARRLSRRQTIMHDRSETRRTGTVIGVKGERSV